MNRSDRKIFTTLFFSIFAAVTGVGIVVPLLPVYAHDLGAGGLYIGLVFGSFSLTRTLFLPLFGRRSDYDGRKPYIVAGLLGYALISLAFILAHNIPSLIVIRFLQGISSAMMMPVIQAYVGDITPPGREGVTMGLFNMSLFFGLSIGPLIGGVISDRFNLQAAFFGMGILATAGFLLSFFLLPPRRQERIVVHARGPLGWRTLLADGDILGLTLFRFSYTACIGIIWGFLPVLADVEFALSSSLIGILVMLGVFISGIIHGPMGYLADRVSKKAMVICGGVIAAAATLSFVWAGGFWHLFAASVFFGIGGGIAMPALMAIAVLKGSRAAAMGSVMGLLTMSHSLGMLTGSLAAGLMMDLFELRHVFPLGAAVMAFGIAGFVLSLKPEKALPAASLD